MATQIVTILAAQKKIADVETSRWIAAYLKGPNRFPVAFFASWVDTWSPANWFFHQLQLSPKKHNNIWIYRIKGGKLAEIKRLATKILRARLKQEFFSEAYLRAIVEAIDFAMFWKIEVIIRIAILGSSRYDEDVEHLLGTTKKAAQVRSVPVGLRLAPDKGRSGQKTVAAPANGTR